METLQYWISIMVVSISDFGAGGSVMKHGNKDITCTMPEQPRKGGGEEPTVCLPVAFLAAPIGVCCYFRTVLRTYRWDMIWVTRSSLEKRWNEERES